MYKYIKRSLDIIFASGGLVILSPVLLLISITILVQMGRPIVFKQPRPGLNAKTFNILKFRTMTEEKDENGVLLPDKQRLTRLGNFLRKWSLDELPQLWNVAKGDMSIVGPRPLFISYLPYYSERESRRHEVLPGITGLAQINGRNTLDWVDRLDYDCQYVEQFGLLMDVKIMIGTFSKVMSGDGVRTPGSVVRPLNIVRSTKLKSLTDAADEQSNHSL